MPYKKPVISKVYYSIGEVADILSVNASLIRFWEKEFEVIKLRKNSKGNRVFTKADVDKLQIIYSLVKEKGYTLQGAREALKKGSDTLEDKQQLLKTLLETRELLSDLLQKSQKK